MAVLIVIEAAVAAAEDLWNEPSPRCCCCCCCCCCVLSLVGVATEKKDCDEKAATLLPPLAKTRATVDTASILRCIAECVCEIVDILVDQLLRRSCCFLLLLMMHVFLHSNLLDEDGGSVDR